MLISRSKAQRKTKPTQKLLMQTYFPSFEKFPLKRRFRPDWFISIRQHPIQQVDGVICSKLKTTWANRRGGGGPTLVPFGQDLPT
ncbi:hypothetical protein TYRP_016230 [Tyrophagus putrescentiae]|nr:hypothetical protein TYRP_016230 [Tyrophagus putrescentiae]